MSRATAKMPTATVKAAPPVVASSPRRLLFLFSLAMFGLGISLFLTYEYLQGTNIPCTDTGCDIVRIWHNEMMPIRGLVPGLGSLYFLVLTAAVWKLGFSNANEGRRFSTVLLGLAGIGTLVMLGLLSIEAFRIHAFCLWCLFVAASVFLFTAVAVFEWRGWQRGQAPYKLDFEPFLKWGAVPIALVFLLVNGLKPQDSVGQPNDSQTQNSAGSAPAIPMSELVSADSHIKGPVNARVTITEFADPGCPACAQEYPAIDAFLKKHPTDVRLVFRYFPLKSHIHSLLAAQAEESAGAQGKFWPMRDLLFKHYAEEAEPQLYEYAQQLGLNMTQFKNDLTSHKYLARVEEDRKAGDALGVNKTPTLFFDGRQRYDGPMTPDMLEQAYKQEFTDPPK